jgi:hypothetical protein
MTKLIEKNSKYKYLKYKNKYLNKKSILMHGGTVECIMERTIEQRRISIESEINHIINEISPMLLNSLDLELKLLKSDINTSPTTEIGNLRISYEHKFKYFYLVDNKNLEKIFFYALEPSIIATAICELPDYNTKQNVLNHKEVLEYGLNNLIINEIKKRFNISAVEWDATM